MADSQKVFIYALKDPRTDEIRYIGKSAHPAKRLEQHLHDRSTNYAKVLWLDELRLEGLQPQLLILEEVDAKSWPEAEQRWMDQGWKRGWPLVNIKCGGEGACVSKFIPDFEFFHAYLPLANQKQFDDLPLGVKIEVCRKTALAMFPYRAEAIRRRKLGYVIDWDWVKEQAWTAGSHIAPLLVAQFANPSNQ